MEPLRAIVAAEQGRPAFWTERLILYVRVMAVLALIKGLYHWAKVCGIWSDEGGFEGETLSWRAATVFFAVIDLVAAVGLWLAAAWGGVVWLTAAISMAAVEVFFPQVFGGRFVLIAAEAAAVGGYLALAVLAARERDE